MTIDKILAEEIADSRGNPTLQVTIFSGSTSDSFSVPSGASTGAHEAYELRDDDKKGVQTAIKNIHEFITPALIGKEITDQRHIDEILIALDGTPNKKHLGGNALIGVSIACAKTAAKIQGKQVYEYLRSLRNISPSQKVPYLYINLINGGKHAKGGPAFQEYHIVPQTNDIRQAIAIGIQTQETLRALVKEKYILDDMQIGDEGGIALPTTDVEEPLALLSEAVEKNRFPVPVRFALDVAASSFSKDGMYFVNNTYIDNSRLADIYDRLIKKYNLISIEDPFNEDAFTDFAKLSHKHPQLLVVGDDISVTNKEHIKKSVEKESITAVIIKPNQIGTLSETLEAMAFAREKNLELIVSHRSGETMDDFIADLAYAFGCFGLKAGSPTKEERLVKYSRLENITSL
jgi:enolase